ncbi:Transcription factor DIVARICATA [Linum grandiflorum]
MLRWSWEEDKEFETALVTFPDGMPDRWERIAGLLPGKSEDDVLKHFEDLVMDVMAIDGDVVELPRYVDDGLSLRLNEGGAGTTEGSNDGGRVHGKLGIVEKETTSSERKKGTPWTAEEHRRFLEGLKEYGKGDWRSIARNAVKTRTSSQVASHAQKYFLRRISINKERKRRSIHDITDELEEGPSGDMIQQASQSTGFQDPLSSIWADIEAHLMTDSFPTFDEHTIMNF